MRDIANNIGVVQAVGPAVLSATNASDAIDLLGFGSAAIVINTGAIVSAGNFTAKLQHSDTTTPGDFEDIEPSELVGELPATLEAASIYKQGYLGHKRYLRTVMTKNSGTSIAVGAVALMAGANERPIP